MAEEAEDVFEIEVRLPPLKGMVLRLLCLNIRPMTLLDDILTCVNGYKGLESGKNGRP
jgi:hypothetical protein